MNLKTILRNITHIYNQHHFISVLIYYGISVDILLLLLPFLMWFLHHDLHYHLCLLLWINKNGIKTCLQVAAFNNLIKTMKSNTGCFKYRWIRYSDIWNYQSDYLIIYEYGYFLSTFQIVKWTIEMTNLFTDLLYEIGALRLRNKLFTLY